MLNLPPSKAENHPVEAFSRVPDARCFLLALQLKGQSEGRQESLLQRVSPGVKMTVT